MKTPGMGGPVDEPIEEEPEVDPALEEDGPAGTLLPIIEKGAVAAAAAAGVTRPDEEEDSTMPTRRTWTGSCRFEVTK